MSNVHYFERPEIPSVTFFHCERLLADLSVPVCASMWNQANSEKGHTRYTRCKHCPLGAQHAGNADANLSPLRNAKFCARCGRPAERLIHDHLCVSCQNREYEWSKGRNAKGKPPVKQLPLAPGHIRYMAGRQLCSRTFRLVKNHDEMVIAALRAAPERVMFGMVCTPVGTRQLRLF